jgi:hypothetical protein
MRVTLISLICAVAFRATVLQAAPITWSAASNISQENNIYDAYPVVAAYNLGTTGVTSATVNGVTFAPFPITGATNAVGNFSLTFSGTVYATNSAFGSTETPFSGLTAPYQTLLQSGVNSNNEITLTIGGLTVGQPYVFQWLSNDSGPQFPQYDTTAAGGGNTVVLNDNLSNTAGGLGQWATGAFTADSTSEEVITFSGNTLRPLLNAFQLEAVPEPASLSLLALTATSLLLRRQHACRLD